MAISLSEKHGLNPMIPKCFVCGEDKNIIALMGRLPGDREAPRNAVIDREPCGKCKEYMKSGVILISVRAPRQQLTCKVCGHKWTHRVYEGALKYPEGDTPIKCPHCGVAEIKYGEIFREEGNNPYRTGGWAVVKDDAIANAFGPESPALKTRVAFIDDNLWDMLGLPEHT